MLDLFLFFNIKGKVIDQDDFKEKIKSDTENDKIDNLMKIDKLAPKISEINKVSQIEENVKEENSINDSDTSKPNFVAENPGQQNKSKPRNTDLAFFF